MNQRISEIANQLGFFGPNFLISTQELEKFAELIVRECAEFQTNRSTERHGYDKHEDGVAIKEHFGVE